MVQQIFTPSVVINNYSIEDKQSQELRKIAQQKLSAEKTTQNLWQFLVNNNEQTKAERVKNCANFITYRIYNDLGIKKLESINLCRERLCLNCQKMLALDRLPSYIYSLQGQRTRHVVLTVKNVTGTKLRETILQMKKALKMMMRALKVKDYIPSYEITYNEEKNTYHPHIHILCKAENITYKKTALKKIWADYINKVMGTNYKYLMCENKLVENVVSASLEMCKYISKPTSITEKTIPILYYALKGLHLHQANGLFKRRIAEYNGYTEAEKTELNNLLQDYEYTIEQYLFNGENYIKIE